MKRPLDEMEAFRAQELLLARATQGLDDAEAAELAALGVADDISFELAAAAVDLATAPMVPLPAYLADKLAMAAPIRGGAPTTLTGVIPAAPIRTTAGDIAAPSPSDTIPSTALPPMPTTIPGSAAMPPQPRGAASQPYSTLRIEALATEQAALVGDREAEQRRVDEWNVTPGGTEPRSIEPRSIEPRSIEPRSIEPRSIEPRSIEPRSIEPRSIEPRSIEPSNTPIAVAPSVVAPTDIAPSIGAPPVAAARATEAAKVVPIRKRSRSATVAWIAAAACFALAAGAVVWATQREPQVAALPNAAEARTALLAARDAVRVDWTATADPAARGATGDVVWSPAEQRGYMRFVGLAPNDRTRTQYQLWIFDRTRDDKFPVDGGVFDVTESGEVIVPIAAKLRVDDATFFAVTIEQPGGVVVSKREHIVVTATPAKT